MTQPLNIVPLGSTETPADGKPDAMPPEAWEALQQAGTRAAERLRDLIEANSFKRLKPTDQARLIQLALDRAYGPPVKREMSLTLSGTVSDAVAESLGRLASADLPEMRPNRRNTHKMTRDTGDT